MQLGSTLQTPKTEVYRVTGLEPESVFCKMTCSKKTGADIFTSALIQCTNGATSLGPR